MVYEITPDQVQDTIKAHSLCMVNFGAEWCIDCRRAAPFYKKFSEEFTDQHNTLSANILVLLTEEAYLFSVEEFSDCRETELEKLHQLFRVLGI